MPPLSLLTDDVNLANRKYILTSGVGRGAEEIAIGYGENVRGIHIDFLIIAFTIFIVIRFINGSRRKQKIRRTKTVETPKNIELLANLERIDGRTEHYPFEIQRINVH